MSGRDDFNDLRDFDDELADDPGDFGGDEIVIDDGRAQRGGLFGMSPVEQIIIAVFVLLNVIALFFIILILTGRMG